VSALSQNIRRLMAQQSLSYDELVEASGLDARTIRGLVRGASTPHARTLHRLAAGLGVPIDELFHSSDGSPEVEFDFATNPIIGEVAAAHPEIFAGWTTAEFRELASRFGVGGGLSEKGAIAAAHAMNAKRRTVEKLAVILESDQADLVTELVDMIFDRVTIKAFAPSAPPADQYEPLA
jgi:transcriptional regulator with XRE-family HTH domain